MEPLDPEVANVDALALNEQTQFVERVRDLDEFAEKGRGTGWSSDRYLAAQYGKSAGACWHFDAKHGLARPKLEGEA